MPQLNTAHRFADARRDMLRHAARALASLMLLAGNAHALDAPTLRDAALINGQVRLSIDNVDVYSGINVYRNGNYLTTYRDIDSSGHLSLSGDAAHYCVVGFVDSPAGTRYSICSNTLQVSPSTAPVSEDRSNSNAMQGDWPGAPRNLRLTRYSDTAAELFWEPADSTAGITHYEIRRDTAMLGTTDGRSHFDSTLTPDMQATYTVTAIDRNGRMGPAASVTLRGTGERHIAGDAHAIATFDLHLAQPRIALTEGAGAHTSLRIARRTHTGKPITLTLRGAGESDQHALSHWFGPATLDSGQSDSTLHLSLAVGARPLGFHERRLILQASDGTTIREQTLVLDITPIDRPDVYLLIGQSNMVGSSEHWAKNSAAGGPDETQARIRQLNVRQNNRGIFYSAEKFRDAYYNVSSPLFVNAEDPLHEPRYPWTTRKEATHIGLGLSFARAALPDTTRQIILVPAAWGASGFCDGGNGDLAWNAWPTSTPGLGGTLLADRAITRLNLALRDSGGILRGILWHQGGHDSNDWRCASRYRDNLAMLAGRLRSEAVLDARGSSARGADADVPFIVATQSRGNDARGNFSRFSDTKQQVDQAHREVSDYLAYADFVNNDDLVPPQYPCGQSSCVHFGAAALREQGNRFYQALQRVWQRQ